MKFHRFLLIMGVATGLALTYIHMQMQIVDLAYQGNAKEKKIKTLVEDNGNVQYKILMLKSANHLGDAMLVNETDMQFADSSDVVQITASEEFFSDNPLQQQPQLVKRTNPLQALLSFGINAEAKIAE